ncbi:MAG: hypothetical protein Q8868_10890 [Bacteroidota bacterium]|nr:hypothetical protein [Bacteroidota bacterium]
MRFPVLIISSLIFFDAYLYSQDSLSIRDQSGNSKIINGFVRGGFYSWTDSKDNKLNVPSAFSDLGLRLETGTIHNFSAFADLRFRYGTEFSKAVSRFDLREAYLTVGGERWKLAVGQKIIKWGRCDFTNPTSKLSPQNMLSRSPDKEDMDMGNLLAEASYYPWSAMKVTAIVMPYYRPSVLITEPIPLPANVTISQPATLFTGSGMLSFALKTEFRLDRFDWSLSWFEGYDPLPGIALTAFTVDTTKLIPVPHIGLDIKPYKLHMAGMDFETTAGPFGIRGEAALTIPFLPSKTNEYVPLPELKYAAGLDWAPGIWRFTGEYSGKYVFDFTQALAGSFAETRIDYEALAALFTTPGFDLHEYARQQVSSFNRLYNYQLKRSYHSAGLRAEAELANGKLLPSVFTMVNLTTRDLLIMPELKVKPSDGLTISLGAEIYSGRSGSLYDLIDDFMDGVFLSLRADF